MRAVVVALALLAIAPTAEARAASCPVTVSRASGAAPLRVTFHARCRSKAYHWRFGDGAVSSGRTVSHTFRGGRFSPVLRAQRGTTRLAPVTSVALTVSAPSHAGYGDTVALRARVTPSLPVRLGDERFVGGRLSVTVTQPFLRVSAGPVTVRKTIVVKPILDVRLDGSRTIGAPLKVVARLRPADA